MDHTVKMQHCNYGFSYLNSRLGIDEILPIGQKIHYIFLFRYNKLNYKHAQNRPVFIFTLKVILYDSKKYQIVQALFLYFSNKTVNITILDEMGV